MYVVLFLGYSLRDAVLRSVVNEASGWWGQGLQAARGGPRGQRCTGSD